MSLATTFLGLRLKSPLIVGSSHLTDEMDSVRRLEDAGASALVLRTLYEEEITGEQMSSFFHAEGHTDSFAEARSYAPEPDEPFGPDEYLEHLRRVKAAVKVPVIAALDGASPETFAYYTRLLQDAGADAVELHLHHPQSDPSLGASEVEARMIATVREVKKGLRIPIAAKLSPLFTAFAHFAKQLDAAGADGLVLFTRFHRADLDVVELEVLRSFLPSDSSELSLRLRGVACLSGRVEASLAVTGGVHTGLDVVKATMTGAHAVELVSALVKNGPAHLATLRRDIEAWMKENEWPSLNEMRGNMGFDRVPDPAAYERARFRQMVR